MRNNVMAGFDWHRHHSASHMMRPGSMGRAFDSARGTDSAASSSYAFLQSALELIEPKLVEPLQAVTHQRDLPIKLGGGFPEQLVAWATNYASSGGGVFGLQGTNNTDIAIAQADVQKGVWPTFNWAQGFTVSYVDLERMKFAKSHGNEPPFTLQELYEGSVKTVWNKALDQVAYFGFQGYPGLVNNTSVVAAVAPNGAGGKTTWVSKTGQEILDDVNMGINLTVQSSGYDIDNGCADSMLVPYTQFAYMTRPITIGGVGYDSVLAYIKKNCVAAQYFGDPDRFKIFPLPNPFISGQGIGNTNGQNVQGNGLDRAIFYRNREESVVLKIPTVMEPAMTIPTDKGPGYSTFFVGCIGSVMFKRPTTFAYIDGV